MSQVNSLFVIDILNSFANDLGYTSKEFSRNLRIATTFLLILKIWGGR